MTGTNFLINGTKPPCNPGRSMKSIRGCQGAMQDFTKEFEVNILYLGDCETRDRVPQS